MQSEADNLKQQYEDVIVPKRQKIKDLETKLSKAESTIYELRSREV